MQNHQRNLSYGNQNQSMQNRQKQDMYFQNRPKKYFIGKRVLITGAASGIGQALSYWYLNQGAFVILVSKDEAVLKQMASKFPTQATVVVSQITEDYQCQVSLKSLLIFRLGPR